MNKKILAIVGKEFRLLIRDKTAFIWMLLLPIFVIFVASAALSSSFEDDDFQITLAINNQDKGPHSQYLIKALQDQPSINLKTNWSQDQLQESIKQGDIGVGLVIPADYSQKIETSQFNNLILYHGPNQTAALPIAKGHLEGIVSQLNAQNLALQTTLNFLQIENINPQIEGAALSQDINVLARELSQTRSLLNIQETLLSNNQEEINAFTQNVPGYALMFMMFGIMTGVENILREREEGTLKRLLTTPMTKKDFLGGKLLANFLIGLLQISLIFGFAYLFFDLNTNASPLGVVLITIAAVFATSGLGIFLAAFVKNRRQLNPIATFVVLISSAIGGSWWPLWITPEWMQQLSKTTITGWAMEGYNNLWIYNHSLIEILPHFLALIIYGIICLLIGLKFFRFQQS